MRLHFLFGLSATLFSFATTVNAADLQSGKALTPGASTWSWSGGYIGTHLSSAAIANDWKSADGALADAVPFAGQFTGGGIAYGLQAGYNYQFGRNVVGIEAEASLADIDGPARCGLGILVCNTTINALGTITGRFGQAYDRFLIYGKAGAAWAHQKAEMVPTAEDEDDVYHGKSVRWGWAVGAGLEFAMSSAWSAKLEYNYIAFDSAMRFASQSGDPTSVALRQDMHLFKVGLNARLGDTSANFRLAPPDATPAYDWTGWYAGIHATGVLGNTDWTSATGLIGAVATQYFPGSGRNEGVALGGQFGFNRQLGQWVIGAEADASWADIDGYAKCAATLTGLSLQCHTHVDAMGSVTGRIGVTSGNLLFYGKGGLAWGKSSYAVIDPSTQGAFHHDTVQTGYVVGSGIDYAFSSAWSGRLEYSYVDFGSDTRTFVDTSGRSSEVALAQQMHLFRMGLNYRIGAPAQQSEARQHWKAPAQFSAWQMEAGARYWFSNGKSQQDLYGDALGGILNSRLIYGDMNGHSGEAFVRADHASGFFAKANFGVGALVNGTLNDEDFPPAISLYSNTEHRMKDGGLRFGSLDLGYNLIDNPTGRLGAFAGYRYFHQRGRGFGCTQIASGEVCETPIPESALSLTETEEWRGVAIGMNARLALSPRWTVDVDAAFLPYVNRAGTDNHWFRGDINPGPETGRGWGTQVEAILSYAVSDRLSVGLGGRYWFMTTNEGAALFPGAEQGQPLKFTSDRYGGFLQASYRIGGPDVRVVHEQAAPVNWTGAYVGGHFGAGFGRSNWSDPFPAPPTGDRVITGGALAGLQLGYNDQAGRMVYGAELSASFGRIEGSQTCFGGIEPATMAGLNCDNRIGALGSLTGRLGYAFDQSMVYARAGLAVADKRYRLNSQLLEDGGLSKAKATNWGWTAGAGIAHALNERWSVNLEYQYFDFGSDTVAFVVPDELAPASASGIKTSTHLTRVGVNYRFH